MLVFNVSIIHTKYMRHAYDFRVSIVWMSIFKMVCRHWQVDSCPFLYWPDIHQHLCYCLVVLYFQGGLPTLNFMVLWHPRNSFVGTSAMVVTSALHLYHLSRPFAYTRIRSQHLLDNPHSYSEPIMQDSVIRSVYTKDARV